jgi:hypothetical protein
MSLHFDDLSSSSSSSSSGYLWAHCDDQCKGHSTVFSLDVEGQGQGQFEEIASYKRPGDMPNINNEGFTSFPESRCDLSTGLKRALWSDDSSSEGHALRQGTLPCGTFADQ